MKTDKLKMQFDAIADILDYCERRIKDVKQEYVATGEYVPVYDWENGKHVQKFNEDGSPVTRERYEYRDKNPESLDPEDIMRIEVYERLQEIIFKSIKDSFKF